MGCRDKLGCRAERGRGGGEEGRAGVKEGGREGRNAWNDGILLLAGGESAAP